MKVKHDANELNEGETMILTLADRRILDDQGTIMEDPEELENVLVVSTNNRLDCQSFCGHHMTPVSHALCKTLAALPATEALLLELRS